ncbi:MAG: ABC transporter permease [Planctomycetota bacterium]
MSIDLAGEFTHQTLHSIWHSLSHSISDAKSEKIVLDARQITSCDGAGIAFLSYLLHHGRDDNSVEIVHLKKHFQELLDHLMSLSPTEHPPEPVKLNAIEKLGELTVNLIEDLYLQIAFWGRTITTSLWLLAHPRKFRWKDFFYISELAGAQGIGIVALLGLLFGLIMAFSSAMPLRQFGVEIYVADLVAIALVRVLGPFITAIIVTGRTGSAFAAEIGTMKISNEIDALEVMNLNPFAFLVIPRILATTLATPLLTLIANLLGLVGCGIVIMSLGYPLNTYLAHVQDILTPTDLTVGMIKPLVYGLLIGGIGCLRGMQTKIGSGAVGIATTRAVVTSIVLLVVTEGIFSILLYVLDI